MNRRTAAGITGALIVGVAALTAGCGQGGGEQSKNGKTKAPSATVQQAGAEATPVRVAAATEQSVSRLVPVTGSVAALQTVELTPRVSARVVSVAGREGAAVRRGQTVVQQDTSDLITDVQRAEANLQSAIARLEQSRTQASLQVTQSSTGIQDARQQLRSAQAQLELARRPQRTQEIAALENAVAQAQARYDKAVADRKRYEQLAKEGAVAESVAEQYRTDATVAEAALNTARQNLSAGQEGGRQASIESAEAAVMRARTALRLAQANQQQNQVREDEVRANAAAVAQNRAALAFARQQLAYASIKSPIDGVISERLTEPGQQAAPGAPVLRVVALDNVFFEAQVPETDIRAVRAGQSVSVRVDAFPNRVFNGRIAKVYPTANTQSRNFIVRVVVPNGAGLLRPGLFARGEVVAERRRGVVVPKDAIVSRDGKTQLYVAGDDRKAEMRSVRVGIMTAETAEILSGVRPGEQVVVAGQDALKDGAAIRVQGSGEQRAAQAF